MKRVHFLGKTFLVRVAWVHFLKHDFVVFLWGYKKERHSVGECLSFELFRDVMS